MDANAWPIRPRVVLCTTPCSGFQLDLVKHYALSKGDGQGKFAVHPGFLMSSTFAFEAKGLCLLYLGCPSRDPMWSLIGCLLKMAQV